MEFWRSECNRVNGHKILQLYKSCDHKTDDIFHQMTIFIEFRTVKKLLRVLAVLSAIGLIHDTYRFQQVFLCRIILMAFFCLASNFTSVKQIFMQKWAKTRVPREKQPNVSTVHWRRFETTAVKDLN